jgi:hypothetical protein
MQDIYRLPTVERERQGEKAYQHLLSHYSIPAFHQCFWQEKEQIRHKY